MAKQRQKSIEDIIAQSYRIQSKAEARSRDSTGGFDSHQYVRAIKAAEIAQRYINNITGTKSYKRQSLNEREQGGYGPLNRPSNTRKYSQRTYMGNSGG